MSGHLLLNPLPVRACGLASGVRPRAQPYRLQHVHRHKADARLPQRALHVTNARRAQDPSSQPKKSKQKKKQEPELGNKRAAVTPEILGAEEDTDADEDLGPEEELLFEELLKDLIDNDFDSDSEEAEGRAMAFEEWLEGEDRIPVTIITGYSGSGKTTLLKNLLKKTRKRDEQVAVVDNIEAGDIDDDNSESDPDSDEDDQRPPEGLIGKLEALLLSDDEPDHVVIKTTATADLKSIVVTCRVSESLEEDLVLDGVITLVDAQHIEQHLNEKKPQAVDQIAYADRILLNKTDLVSEEQLDRVEKRIRAINSLAQIRRVQNANIPADYALDIGGFEAALVGKQLDRDEHELSANGASDSHSYNDEVSSVSIVLDGSVDPEKVNTFLEETLLESEENIYRYKGIMSIDGHDTRSIIQGVNLDFSADNDRKWRPDEKRRSTIVFIGKDLPEDKLRKGLEACVVKEKTGRRKKEKSLPSAS